MPRFLVHQTHLITDAANALEAQIKLTADTIVETRIERLSDEEVPSLRSRESQTVSE